jgi:hypothetical protein
MDEQAPNYHREFLKSPQHAALGLLTLGVGFMSGMMLPLIAGVTCYSLGWIYLPDLPFFRRWVDRRREAAKRAEEMKRSRRLFNAGTPSSPRSRLSAANATHASPPSATTSKLPAPTICSLPPTPPPTRACASWTS